MRAKGKSPTSAIAPPASIENHGGGQSSSRISPKLRGCQQSQITSSRAPNKIEEFSREQILRAQRTKALPPHQATRSPDPTRLPPPVPPKPASWDETVRVRAIPCRLSMP